MNHFSSSTKNDVTTTDNEPTSHSRSRISGQLGEVPKKSVATDFKTQRSSGIVRWLVKQIRSNFDDLPVTIVLPDGQVISPANKRSLGTIKIKDKRTILVIALDPLFQFPEAYTNGDLEMFGDMTQCLTAIYGNMKHTKGPSFGQRILNRVRQPTANTLGGSKQNVNHHYNLGNDFYKLWLDERRLYTCAYFARANFSLEQAQLAKMDHVCRKLKLKPGMQVFEAGCGWGALAMHMAKHYGVRVKAYNISTEQINWAREKSQQQGLSDQIEFVQDDWRTMRGKCDAFVSVGMLEHVGVKNYPQLGKTILRSLKPNGLGLIHTIGQNHPVAFNSWIERRIFPGAYPPTLKQMTEIFESGDFQILDVENLRLHYAETLRHWLDRFESTQNIVRETFDDRFVRMWRMYLAGSVAAFDSGYLQLYQVVFANGESNFVPRTREFLYDSVHDRVASAVRIAANQNTLNNSHW